MRHKGLVGTEDLPEENQAESEEARSNAGDVREARKVISETQSFLDGENGGLLGPSSEEVRATAVVVESGWVRMALVMRGRQDQVWPGENWKEQGVASGIMEALGRGAMMTVEIFPGGDRERRGKAWNVTNAVKALRKEGRVASLLLKGQEREAASLIEKTAISKGYERRVSKLEEETREKAEALKKAAQNAASGKPVSQKEPERETAPAQAEGPQAEGSQAKGPSKRREEPKPKEAKGENSKSLSQKTESPRGGFEESGFQENSFQGEETGEEEVQGLELVEGELVDSPEKTKALAFSASREVERDHNEEVRHRLANVERRVATMEESRRASGAALRKSAAIGAVVGGVVTASLVAFGVAIGGDA